jgi:hypothetical protein
MQLTEERLRRRQRKNQRESEAMFLLLAPGFSQVTQNLHYPDHENRLNGFLFNSSQDHLAEARC